jgi:excisionase family DNA binding protein
MTPEKKYITVPELAKALGVSRIAVYKRVKKGQIPAARIGRTYVITDKTVADVLGNRLTDRGRARIDAAVSRAVQEYGEVLKKLGRE